MSGPWSFTRRLLKRGVRQMSGRNSDRQAIWESKWSSEGYVPPWFVEQPPPVVVDAVESGWIRPGSSIIDIGCGSGELAAWLAAAGFSVVGVDYAKTAIDRAAATQEVRSGADLVFRVVDMCGPPPELGRFDVLVDRGCFHGIDVADRPAYGRSVAAISRFGSRFMMMCRLRELSKQERVDAALGAVGQWFTLDDVTDCAMSEGSSAGSSIAGVCISMTRMR